MFNGPGIQPQAWSVSENSRRLLGSLVYLWYVYWTKADIRITFYRRGLDQIHDRETVRYL